MAAIDRIANHHEYRRAVDVGVVRTAMDACCRPTVSVREHASGLAFDLRIAVAHADRRFLMAAGDELGLLVAAIDRPIHPAAEAGAGVGEDVLESREPFQAVDHEVRSGAIGGRDLDVQRRDFSRPSRRGHRSVAQRNVVLGDCLVGGLLGSGRLGGSRDQAAAPPAAPFRNPPRPTGAFWKST